VNRRRNVNKLLLPEQQPSLEKGRNEAAVGRLHRAAYYFERAIKAGDAGVDAAHLALSDLYYEWNELNAAANHIQAGLSISKLHNNIPMEISALKLWARLQVAVHYRETANEAMEQVHDLTEAHQMPAQVKVQNVEWEIGLALNQNDLSQVSHWLNQLSVLGDVFYPMQSVPYVRALIALDRKEEAAYLLEEWIGTAVHNHLITITISLLALQSVVTFESPTTFLIDALTLANKENFIRSFVDIGAGMKQVLLQAKNNNTFSTYIETLLTAFTQPLPKIPELAVPPYAPINPAPKRLSTEDMVFIRLLMSGKSSQEIANQLRISHTVVKQRINQLNRKLGI
jgi:LuxR family transcriptional regulator, maltose regulon positive regulatory protein